MTTQVPWLIKLQDTVKKKPIIVLRFTNDEWTAILESRQGANRFTTARSRSLVERMKVPTLCLINGQSGASGGMYVGIASRKHGLTTLESVITIKRGAKIEPRSEAELIQLCSQRDCARNLRNKLGSAESVVTLSPELSSHLVERLASIPANQNAMRCVAELLSVPDEIKESEALQEDAIRMALKAFGITPDHEALSLVLVGDTALKGVNITEDSVIEHDARCLPGYDLVESDLTGHAAFERGDERLEVFTANRGPLERVFGVDLIYLNATRQSIVMLQYKMLEPERKDGNEKDWVYRPNEKLEDEIRRMRSFTGEYTLTQREYRLNAAVYYLKFVKREGAQRNGGIIIPVEHFEKICADPAFHGPRGGLRVSYNSLSGRYLRESTFLELIQSGYIGGHEDTTAHLLTLVEAVLRHGNAAVAAIQSSIATPNSI